MKILNLLVGLAVAGVLFFAYRSYRSAQVARDSLASINQERAKLAKDVELAETRLKNVKNDESELQTALHNAETEHANSAPKSRASTSSQAKAEPPKRPDQSALMQTNPELRDAFKRSTRANLALRYRMVYDAAKLSPQQIDKFETAMVEAEQDKMDLASAGAAQGLKPDDPEMKKMRDQQEEKLKTAQQEALGDAGYQELLHYQRIEPLLGTINMTAMLVAQTATPITTSQVQQITDLLATTSKAYQNGGKADPASIDWQAALPKLQAVLPPAQFESFKANAQGAQMFALVRQYYKEQKGMTK